MRIYAVLAFIIVAAACSNGSGGYIKTSSYSGTRITPDYFQFSTIVEAGDEPYFGGGWRAVCIRARVSQGVYDYRQKQERMAAQSECDLEFGAPILLASGRRVSLREARRDAAHAANAAAESVITTTRRITSQTCDRIKRRADKIFNELIPGSRVSRCEGFRGMSVPEVRWP